MIAPGSRSTVPSENGLPRARCGWRSGGRLGGHEPGSLPAGPAGAGNHSVAVLVTRPRLFPGLPRSAIQTSQVAKRCSWSRTRRPSRATRLRALLRWPHASKSRPSGCMKTSLDACGAHRLGADGTASGNGSRPADARCGWRAMRLCKTSRRRRRLKIQRTMCSLYEVVFCSLLPN